MFSIQRELSFKLKMTIFALEYNSVILECIPINSRQSFSCIALFWRFLFLSSTCNVLITSFLLISLSEISLYMLIKKFKIPAKRQSDKYASCGQLHLRQDNCIKVYYLISILVLLKPIFIIMILSKTPKFQCFPIFPIPINPLIFQLFFFTKTIFFLYFSFDDDDVYYFLGVIQKVSNIGCDTILYSYALNEYSISDY